MDRKVAPMKGESAKRMLLRHPPETAFQKRARLAEEDAARREVLWWATGVVFATAAAIAVCFWLVVR